MLKTPMLTMNTSPPRTMKIPMKKPVPSSGVAMVVGSWGESGQVALWSVAIMQTCVSNVSQCITILDEV